MTVSRPRREHVVVVGGGAAGTFAAILLARAGARVTLLDKDPTPVPASLAGVAGWARPGAPQSGHSHAFLARLRILLAAHAPDLLDALLAAGVREIRLSNTAPATLLGTPPADPELVVLGARRPVLDWVLRRAVSQEPGVELRAGARVVGLVVDPPSGFGTGGPPLVTGVRLDDGARLDADLVVDAGGRRSRWQAWLADAGVTVPPVTAVGCGIAYYSRFYRRADAAAPLPTELNRGHTAGSSFDRYSCLVFPADNDTFSVTFGILPEDAELRVLRHGAAFDAAARSIPMIAPWLGETGVRPLSSVAAMSGLNNVVRPWTDPAGHAVARNLLPVGDAAFITNPAHTRGTTLALLSAVRLAEAVAATGDFHERSTALDVSLRTELLPWFTDSCAQDAARLSRWRSTTAQAAVPPQQAAAAPPSAAVPQAAAALASAVPPFAVPASATRVSNGEAFTAAARDPVVWHRFTRLQNLLAAPESVLADPDFVARVRAVLATGWSPPRSVGPGHDDLVALANHAVPTRSTADSTADSASVDG